MHDPARTAKGSPERPTGQNGEREIGVRERAAALGDAADDWWKDTRLHREMAYTGGILYTSGGLLVLATLLPSWDLYAPSWIAAVGVVALAVGLFYFWAAERWSMPMWQYSVATSLGAVLVTVAAYGGGHATTATYGILYVFVTGYGFYYYPGPIAWWFVILSGLGFAGALAWHDVHAATVQWIVVVGGVVIAGGLIGTLGRRMRGLLALEHARLEDLSELDEWKTTFLRAVAHDLRSPLASMIGLIALVRDRPELAEEQKAELISRSVGAGERLQRLIEDLLDVERIEAGDIKPRLESTALHDLVRQTIEHMDVGDRRVHLDLAPVTATVEPTKVERIVENLVGNAMRHTPDGTQVWVRVQRDEESAILTIEDDGPGLPANIREDPFSAFAARRTSGTTGLGLHLVGRFTELHGGSLRACEARNGGACVEVRLPLAPDGLRMA